MNGQPSIEMLSCGRAFVIGAQEYAAEVIRARKERGQMEPKVGAAISCGWEIAAGECGQRITTRLCSKYNWAVAGDSMRLNLELVESRLGFESQGMTERSWATRCGQALPELLGFVSNVAGARFDRDMVERKGRAGAEDSAVWREDSAVFESWAQPVELGCEIQLGTVGTAGILVVGIAGELGRSRPGFEGVLRLGFLGWSLVALGSRDWDQLEPWGATAEGF